MHRPPKLCLPRYSGLAMKTLSLNHISEAYFEKLFLAKNNSQLAASVKGRVLLVDQHTMAIISMSYSHSQLLQNDVILVESINKSAQLSPMKHLNCIVYVKPSRDSIQLLCQELQAPHYNSYQIFFNNSVNKSDLEAVALADVHKAVNQVTEVFQDYSILNDNLFEVSPLHVAPGKRSVIEECSSLLSLLLGVKKCPVIKYDTQSIELKRLASEVLYYINSNSNNNLFDELNQHNDLPPLLVILDRKIDPVSPLVAPWTYQLMIHELIGINRNVVRTPGASGQAELLPLSETSDAFFHETMYFNYGDLTDRFQKYVDLYKKQTKQSSIENLKTQDLSELKKILTRFPEYKKLSNNILKHLNIISEIDLNISKQNLWLIGELQQTILCDLESFATIKSKMADLVSDPGIPTIHKVKMMLIFIAKNSHHQAEIASLVSKLSDPITTSPQPSDTQMRLIKKWASNKRFSGTTSESTANKNIGNLFNNNRIKIQSLFNGNSKQAQATRNDNIYMQYIPKLSEIVNSMVGSADDGRDLAKLQELHGLATLVPDCVANQYGKNLSSVPAQEIIVYFKGGVTYEEARLAHELTNLNPNLSMVIGSDTVLNSASYLAKLCDELNEPVEPDLRAQRAQLRDLL